jgi:hypothetical protein
MPPAPPLAGDPAQAQAVSSRANGTVAGAPCDETPLNAWTAAVTAATSTAVASALRRRRGRIVRSI